MLAISTTALYCIGDDLIREGVERICGVGDEPTVWFNKSDMRVDGKRHRTFWVDPEMPPTKAVVAAARAVIIAGTPSWLDRVGNVYLHCIETGTPLWIIGAGKAQKQVDVLAKANAAGLVHVATARDKPSQATMAAAGIDAPIFFDPAFHADYPTDWVAKSVDLAVCYKTDDAVPGLDKIHHEIAAKFGDRIEAVFVHSPREIADAYSIYGMEPFYHHEYRRFLPRYAACRCIIAGRLHAAIPVLAMGGSAHVIYQSEKREMLQRLEDDVPVKVYYPADWREIDVDADLCEPGASERIQDDFDAHAAYVRERIQ